MKGDTDDPSASMTIVVGVIGTILLLAVIVFAVVLFRIGARSEFERKVVQAAPREIAQLRSQQLSEVSQTKYVDQARQHVQIPVEEALPLFAEIVKKQGVPSTIKASAAPPATQPASMESTPG
jgi:hypothetical protein